MQIRIRGTQNIISQLITQQQHGAQSCKVLDGFNPYGAAAVGWAGAITVTC